MSNLNHDHQGISSISFGELLSFRQNLKQVDYLFVIEIFAIKIELKWKHSKPHFPALTIQKRLRGIVDDDFFPDENPFPADELLDACCFAAIFRCSDELHILIPTVQNFTARIVHVMCSGTIHQYSLSYFIDEILPDNCYIVTLGNRRPKG